MDDYIVYPSGPSFIIDSNLHSISAFSILRLDGMGWNWQHEIHRGGKLHYRNTRYEVLVKCLSFISISFIFCTQLAGIPGNLFNLGFEYKGI